MTRTNLAASSINDAYLWPWMMMVHSAHSNSGTTQVKYLLANINQLLSPGAANLAREFCEIIGADLQIIEISTDLESEYRHQFNITVYARIFLLDQLEEKFLWLDSDLLLHPGWSSIFAESGDKSSQECVFHAVKDIEETHKTLMSQGNAAYEAARGRYFNSGVLMADPKKWRELQGSDRWKAMASDLKGYSLKFPDQDVLNFLGATKTSLLPRGYNTIAGTTLTNEEPMYIQHFAGSPKPWTMTQESKEFLLAIQGANYFRQAHSVMTLRDAFTEYPAYWEAEEKLLAYLSEKDPVFFMKVEANRSRYSREVDIVSKIKGRAIKFLARKFR